MNTFSLLLLIVILFSLSLVFNWWWFRLLGREGRLTPEREWNNPVWGVGRFKGSITGGEEGTRGIHFPRLIEASSSSEAVQSSQKVVVPFGLCQRDHFKRMWPITEVTIPTVSHLAGLFTPGTGTMKFTGVIRVICPCVWSDSAGKRILIPSSLFSSCCCCCCCCSKPYIGVNMTL